MPIPTASPRSERLLSEHTRLLIEILEAETTQQLPSGHPEPPNVSSTIKPGLPSTQAQKGLRLLLLLVWFGLSGVPLAHAQIAFGLRALEGTQSATETKTIDLDQDGDLDIVAASFNANALVWWENDGSPSNGGWTKHTIDGAFNQVITLDVADLDGDNDLDVVAGARGDDQVAWWANDGTPSNGGWTKHVVETHEDLDPTHIRAGDIDGDGHIDIYGRRAFTEIAWWRNTGNPAIWTPHVVVSNFFAPSNIVAVDLDNDTHIDLVFGGGITNDLVWAKNDGTPANGGWSSFTIDDAVTTTSIEVADVDADGDLDVVAGTGSSGGGILWWVNDGTPNNSNWTEHTIDNTTSEILDIDMTDFNLDGFVDVAYVRNNVTRMRENDGTPADGGWTDHAIDSPFGPSSVEAVDVTADGIPDVVVGASGDVRWNQTILTGITVKTTSDAGAGSLRQIVSNAPAGLTIGFAATLNGQTITLSSGHITLTRDITIDASALAAGLTIDGNSGQRLFAINASQTVTLRGLTLTRGNPGGSFNGGAVHNAGTLTLDQSTLSSNQATNGGGVFNASGATATVMRSLLRQNTASNSGGGMFNEGTATVSNTTLTLNSATGSGGGFTNIGIATLNNATIYSNTSPTGGGLRNANGGTLLMNSTLIGNSSGSSDCSNSATISMNQHMWIQDNTCSPLFSGDPFLLPLADNGGSTQSYLPRPGSGLLDAGACNSLSSDQRSDTRPVDLSYAPNRVDGCDIGAVEVQSSEGSIRVTSTNDAGAGSLRQLVADVAGGTTLQLDAALNGQTITLSSGHITLTRDITIDASALTNGLTIDGDQGQRIFAINVGQTVTLRRLTLTRGNPGGSFNGGAIHNAGTLTLDQSTLSNSRGTNGGGLFNKSGATATVTRSLLRDNTAPSSGGGMFNEGTATVSNTTLALNTGTGSGGGFTNVGTATLHNTTIHRNLSSVGDGIRNAGAGVLHLNSTVISTVAGLNADCSNDATIATNTRTLIQDGSCSPTLSGNPQFAAALADNGGPTQTFLPQANSPLIDAGSCNGLTNDQRGLPRADDVPSIANADDGCDIGAVEVASSSLLPVELTTFEALRNGDAVRLTWATASETNNAGFEIEQAAGDSPWQAMAFVVGHGTTLTTQTYRYTLSNLTPGIYRFRLRQVDYDGTSAYSPIVEVELEVPHVLHLAAAYPNPFNPSTTLAFTVPHDGMAHLRVYDVLGREVVQVFDGPAAPGQQIAIAFDASGLPSGTYLYQLTFEGQTKVGRMVLMK